MNLSANRLQCRPNLSVTVQRPPQVYDGATLVEWNPETAVVECTKTALLYEGFKAEERSEVLGGYAVSAGVSIAGAGLRMAGWVARTRLLAEPLSPRGPQPVLRSLRVACEALNGPLEPLGRVPQSWY
jgi:hypothetical protein